MNMQRFGPYVALAVAVLFFIYALVFSVGAPRTATAPIPAASSTISVVPPQVVPSIPATVATSTAPTAATSSSPTAPLPVKTVPPKAAPVPAPVTPTSTPPAPVIVTTAPVTVVPVPVPTPTPPPLPATGDIGLDAAATVLRGALVNIICRAPVASPIHSISGSGIFIDSKGIILTNAHIAQYFLLADRNVSCIIRAGSPAVSIYTAELIYIPPQWLRENASVLTTVNPSGNGEFDFALLAINKSTTTTLLPMSFPSLPLATTPPNKGTPVVIATYGAQFLDTSQVLTSLFPTVVFGSVMDVFTFVANTIDVMALGGSAAAQEGSSGGGVADASGKLVGTITTSTVTGATDTRNLDAITASYIRGAYASETGSSVDILLSEPTSTSISDFALKIPGLESILTAELP